MKIKQKTLLSELKEKQPHFSRLIGMELTSVNEDEVVATIKVQTKLANRNGVMHGGAIMGFADNLGGTATFLNLDKNLSTTTIESKTNFLRPVNIGDTLTGVCTFLHKGRKTVVVQTKMYRSDNKVVAITTQTQMILRFEKS